MVVRTRMSLEEVGLETFVTYRLADVVHLLEGSYGRYCLPSDFSRVSEPQFVIPQYGRFYDTTLQGKLLKEDPSGWKFYDQVMGVEMYENWGDDGHTDWTLIGIVFIEVEDYRRIKDAPNKYSGEKQNLCEAIVQEMRNMGRDPHARRENINPEIQEINRLNEYLHDEKEETYRLKRQVEKLEEKIEFLNELRASEKKWNPPVNYAANNRGE